MQLVQILLPLYSNEGEAFPAVYYSQIRDELTATFGGVTAHTHSPATGLWKESQEKTFRDKIVIYEVMIETIDREWWGIFKKRLERVFRQDEIMIRVTATELL